MVLGGMLRGREFGLWDKGLGLEIVRICYGHG